MKKALLLFAMFAFIGTAYTASAAIVDPAGIYCNNCKGSHKCGDDCKKDCKKAKKNKSCTSASVKKKGCCSKGGSTAAKSCHGKTSSKASASAKEKSTEKK